MRYYRPKVSKEWSLVASIIIALNGGASYNFSLWSPLLKRHGLDQKDVAKLGAAHTGFGAYSSFIAGLLYDSLERRHHVGPRLTLLIGCVISSIGFYSLYLGVAQASGPLPFSALAALAVLAGNGCTWFDVSPMSTNLRNFPTGRGSVVGIIKSCIGLCGGLYSIVFYQGLCGGSAEAFLKFLSYGPSLVVLACIPFVNYVPWVQESERVDHVNVQRFMIAIWLIALLTGYVLFVSLVGGLLDVTVHMQRVFAAGAVILLLPLGGIVWGSGGLFAERANVVAGVDGMDGVEVGLLLADDDAFDDMGSAPTEEDENEEDEEDETTRRLLGIYPSFTLRDCFSSANFYLTAIVTAIGIASGLSFLNNSPQLVGSLGGSEQETTIVVAFFSCSSCLGRLLFGAVSEHVMQTHRVSRCWFLVGAAVAATCTYALLSFESIASPTTLYPLSLLSGLTFGGHWSMLPSLASELFGLSSFASIYSVLQLFPGLGAYVLGSYVGERYDAVGKGHGDQTGDCVGADCFAGAFRTITVLSGIGVVGAVVLYRRTRRLYAAMVGRLLEAEDEAFG